MPGKFVAKNEAGTALYYENWQDPRQDGWIKLEDLSGIPEFFVKTLPVKEQNENTVPDRKPEE